MIVKQDFIDGAVGVDLDAARHSLRAFGELAGVPLTPRQAGAVEPVVLGSAPQFTAIVAPRQTGKSRALAVGAAWAALRSPGVRVLVVSASEDAAKRLQRMVRDVLGAPVLRASIAEETTMLVQLSNGSEVRCTSASERSIRGWTADLLIIDEAALLGDDLITGAALPTVAATGGRVLVASSAGPAAGFFFDVVMRGRAGSEHVALHEWTTTDAQWISPSLLAAMRESMSELRFGAEFENRFAGAGSLYFAPSLVRGVVADVELPGLAGLACGEARPWCGLDPSGSGADPAALCGWVRVPEAGPRVFLLALAHAWPSDAAILGPGSYVEEMVSAAVPYGRLIVESNGVGQAVAEEVFRRFRERPPGLGGGVRVARDFDAFEGSRERLSGFRSVVAATAMTAELKSTLFAHLKVLMSRGSVVISSQSEDVIRELLLLGVELNPSGSERIAASAGHDDLAMAAALALQPWRRGDGRWTTLIGRHADPSEAVPGPMRQAVGVGEVVSTPGGVSLPRRPVLQSAHGPELTVPDAVSAVDEFAVMRGRVAAALKDDKSDREVSK